jgi:hypothetical protein
MVKLLERAGERVLSRVLPQAKVAACGYEYLGVGWVEGSDACLNYVYTCNDKVYHRISVDGELFGYVYGSC